MNVTLDDQKIIEVKKLPIGRYAEFLNIVKKILAQAGILTTVDKLTNEQFLSMLPELISQNLPDVLKIIAIGTGLIDEEVSALGLSECIDLLMAIFEVNKYAEVYEKIKKGLARLPKPEIKKTTAIGLPTQ